MRVKITNWKKLSASVFIVGAVFALLSLQTKAASQSDAIAVRIMPNVNHDSIDTWYAKQGFTGSPQSLIVDGYEAIRDGRTVFVNAANLDGTTIYTNIYLISYNQESETNTSDILGQLVSHWKFNSNVTTLGNCSISNLNCQADTDCPSTDICSNSGTTSPGKCVLKTAKVCLIDSDCPVNLFCNSLKASAIRDVKRLGELNQINSAIESAKATNGNYPSLPSGTYISGTSMSVWPSWKETLWAQLGLSQLLVDPINTLGSCNGFDATTCWNNTNNSFITSDLTLPGGSYAFVYTAAKNGINYSLCSVFETKNLGYDTQDEKITSNSCSVNTINGSNTNTAPYVVSSYTDGEAGKEFNGYIKVKDDEGDLISWSLRDSSPLLWANSEWQSWANIAPVLQDTGDSNQKKIYAPKAGNPGTYDMILTLTDSRGAATSTRVIINISAAGKPRIEAEDINYFVDPVNPLIYTFTVEGNNSKPTYTITALDPSFTEINRAVTSSSAMITSAGLNKNKVDFSILIATSTPITQDITVPFRITATADGATSTKDVNFNFKIEKPYLDFNCENMARIGQSYQIGGTNCLLGSLKSGNHTLKYVVSGPDGLFIEETGGNAYLKAVSIVSTTPTSTPVNIKVTNEYGPTNEKSFNLTLNTFCGDNRMQAPNSEGRGGLNNDGIEECDGSEGTQTATNTISTSSSIQYGCTTEDGATSTYPIINNNSCVFKAADEGGGYCGDGVCQFKIKDSVPMENCWNCQQDCGSCLATVTSKADYVQSAFYNSQFLYKTITPDFGTTTLTLASGKNVFGFWSHFLTYTSSIGLSFKVTMGANGTIFKEFNTYDKAPTSSCTTTGIANNSTYNSNYDPRSATGSYANWYGLTYESTWDPPYLVSPENKFQGLPYIWSTSTTSDQIYCRLAFDYQPYSSNTTCHPSCGSGDNKKNCGSDGCGGYCGKVGGNGTCGPNQKCSDRVCVCKPDCNGKNCGSDGCGGFCGPVDKLGICPDAKRWAWYDNGTTGFSWKRMNKPQKCENGQCVCKPDCTNRTCGGDGCGGFCGTCSSGDFCNKAEQCQSCTEPKIECGTDSSNGASCGTCEDSNSTCISNKCVDATIQVCADNAHNTFFNNSSLATDGRSMVGTNWNNIEEFPVTIADQNIFAIEAIDWGGVHGVSATLNVKVDKSTVLSLNTGDSDKWLCNRTATTDWKSDWDADSSWTKSKSMNNSASSWIDSGNALAKYGISQIWLSDPTFYTDGVTYANSATTYIDGVVTNPDYIYCRYKFNFSDVVICDPKIKCAGKCSGSDGCGGLCYSTCSSGQVCGGDINKPNECAGLPTCNQATKTANCIKNGIQYCGGDDGCGGICPNECAKSDTKCGGAGIYNQCG